MAVTASDDEISLDGLMGDDVSAPASSETDEVRAPVEEPQPKPGAVNPAKNAEIDGLLAGEDPDFAQTMSDLKAQGAEATSETEIDSLDLDQLKKEKMPGRIRLFLGWVLTPVFVLLGAPMGEGHTVATRLVQLPGLAILGLRKSRDLAKIFVLWLFAWIKGRISQFRGLPRKSKALLITALVFGALAVFTLKISIGQKLNFNLGKLFFRSFAEVADARFEYDEDEPLEDFTDPLFHPEHMMLLDKFVINLKHPRDGSINPMGLFEFYLEASNQDSAVEIKDRQGEIRDVISRNIEQMTYSDLITVDGKEKMKILLRKAVNTSLTRGQVRHIYIKSIVLKP